MPDLRKQPRHLRPKRPSGARLLRMAWSDVLFLHWPIRPAQINALLPDGLEADVFQGNAWIGLLSFTMSGVRPVMAPAVPGLSSFLELSVRTYVQCRGEPGVFAFSVDASNPVAVWLSRTFLHLPYFRAHMKIARRGETKRFVSTRTHQGAAPADFECVWAPRQPLPASKPGELLHFLTERYRIFSAHRGRLHCCNIWHEPWPLREARVGTLRSSMLEAAGLPLPEGSPLAHHADMLAIDVWPLKEACLEEKAAALFDPALSPPPAT